MYEKFYGLHSRPFELTPDPRYLFLTGRHSEALAHLEYGLTGRKGITLLVGEVGTGKTMLLRAAIERIRSQSVRFAHLSNPMLTRQEFFEALAIGFDLSPEAAQSKVQFLSELEALVRANHASGGVTALIVDEAQALPIDLLEEIRLLANLETDTAKLLQVILVGQPELAARLNEPDLRQLKQRVALRATLSAMSLSETAAYIAGRIRIAGGDAASLFSREAILEIYERSGGVPRLVSVICDNALVTGFATSARPIGRRVIAEVCADFDLRGGSLPGPQRPEDGSAPLHATNDDGAAKPGRDASADTTDGPAGSQQEPRVAFFSGRSGTLR